MSPTNPRILAIVGPTASGKTSLALSIAKKRGVEVVSADSRQIFKYLDIGTAKPSIAERTEVKHHFIDLLEPSCEYNAGQFGHDGREVVTEILKKKKLPLLVGGSGLYVRAVIDGLFDGPGKDLEIRMMLEDQLQSEGLDALLNALRMVDPLTAERMREITPRRVIRALEVYRVTGKPISQLHSEENFTPGFEAYQVGLLWERKELYQRIDKRVEAMISAGLEDEVKSLISKGYDRHLNALNTVGYKEVFEHMAGIHSHEEMIELIKRNTRRFAKRQMTWFRRDQRIRWMRVSGDDWLERVTQTVLEALDRRPRSRR
ncbi:MAG: tRNA (adenosine(37)-N6)-dimethylallyltransferase MiaA [Ignavibacteriales bacterium]|nr:tRNA (adenosine(37)-N6)-dimethylallyltransferase MiaA [Ignavibacteriales bacterium]